MMTVRQSHQSRRPAREYSMHCRPTYEKVSALATKRRTQYPAKHMTVSAVTSYWHRLSFFSSVAIHPRFSVKIMTDITNPNWQV